MKNTISPAFIITLLLLFGLGSIDAKAETDFSGIWSGSWTSYASPSGRLNATITQNGTSLSGTVSVYDTSCLSHPDFIDLAITGSVTSSTATFSLVQSAYCADEGGSLSNMSFSNGMISGNTMNGFYVITTDGEYFDDGTFTLTKSCCTITVTVGEGGTVTPSGSVSVNPGASQTFAIAPQPAYTITAVTVDGDNKGAVSSYTFSNVSSNHTLEATFTREKIKSMPFLIPLLND